MLPHCFSSSVFGGIVIPLTTGDGKLPKAEIKQPKTCQKHCYCTFYFEEVSHQNLNLAYLTCTLQWNPLNEHLWSVFANIKAHNFIFSDISLLNDTSSGGQRTLFYGQGGLRSYKINLAFQKLVIYALHIFVCYD